VTARKKLGEILLQEKVIDEVQLKAALGHQKKWGCRLGTALLELGFLTEDSLTKFLSSQTHVPGIDLINARIPEEVFKTIPKDVASKYGVIPVAMKDTPGRKTIVVAMSNPTDLSALDELEFLTTCKIEPRIAPESSIKKRLQQYGEEFLQIYKATEPPPMDLTEEAPSVEKIVEAKLAEAVPKGQQGQQIIVDQTPEKPSTEVLPEEPVALTEVSLDEEVAPSPDISPSQEPPLSEAPSPQEINAREKVSPHEYADMVVVPESNLPSDVPQPSPIAPLHSGQPPSAGLNQAPVQELGVPPPVPSEHLDLTIQIDALRNELAQVKISLNDAQERLTKTPSTADNTDLYIQIDAHKKDLIQTKKTLEDIKEKLSQSSNFETAVKDLKDLFQVLLNFLIEKGIFTKEELVSRLKRGT